MRHYTSLILDLGKRALVRTVAAKKGAAAFASELFAEDCILLCFS